MPPPALSSNMTQQATDSAISLETICKLSEPNQRTIHGLGGEMKD